jgi:tetratricopeptide (TPR) repeat protein
MDNIVDTVTSLLGRLFDTLAYLYYTDPYSTAIKVVGTFIVFYILVLIVKNSTSSHKGKETNFSSSARNALKHGDYVTAGDFYTYDGKLSKAYDLYIKAGAKKKASEVALRMNNIDTAINLLLETGDENAAARLAKTNNNFKKAGDIYKSIKSYSEAASAYEQAKDYLKAAQMYESAEMFLPAGELYLSSNNINKAAQCYLMAFNSDYSMDKMEMDHEYTVRMIELAKKAGVLLTKVGMHERAAKVYASMKLYEFAAEASKSAGKFLEAAEYFTNANKPVEAANLFEKAGDLVRANTLRAEYYRGIGENEKAAKCYETIEEFMNAAELYSSVANYPKAGEMYEKSGEYELAAQMYENANRSQKAAGLYEKSGNLEKAKYLYKYIGDEKNLIGTLIKEKKFIEAAEQYTKFGDIDSTIRSLQMVSTSEENDYYRACVMLGDIFVDKGMFVQAMEKYKRAIGNKPLDKATVDAYYGIARAIENTGEPSKSIMIYDKILAEDYNYKDVRNRIKTLKEQSQRSREIMPDIDTRYSIVKEIGRGNMGKVYEAYDNVLERKVAYKVPGLDLTHHPELVNDFLREAKSAASLNHPNIVIVYDAGKQGNDYYIAMELIQGKTLKDVLHDKGRFKPEESLKLSEQLVRALVYAHGNNLIHRDIKPGNIMITDDGTVKLMDFGLAKIIRDTTQTATKVIGTPYYMSPEQIKGEKISFETDIYSFGVVLYEMITGRPPFEKGDIYYHHLHTQPPSPQSVVPEISERLSSIVLKCLQKEPERRFPSTSELLSALITLRS